MSATGRGKARNAEDFYGTEGWLVDAVLPHLPLSGRIIDAGAGEGQITSRLLEAGVPASRITAYELSPKRAMFLRDRCPGVKVVVGCYLAQTLDPADLVIGNPPYEPEDQPDVTAFRFVHRSFQHVGPRGTVSMLLRLNWLEGAQTEEPARLAFLREHPPDVLISPKRGKFGLDKHGKFRSDSCAYAWMTWGPGRVGRIFHLDVLPDGRLGRHEGSAESFLEASLRVRQVPLFEGMP